MPTSPTEGDLPSSWSAMSPQKQAVMQELFDTHPDARRLHAAADGDHDFTLWLLKVFTLHWTIAIRPLADLDNPTWRTRYDSRWTPEEAVAAATAPSAFVAGHLVCPHCYTHGDIREEARAIRIHKLIADPSEKITAVVADSHCHHLRYFCGQCDGTVTLPTGTVVECS